MSIRVITLGCRINAYESELIKEIVPKDIDLTVVNTCAVTGEAERQSRQTIRRLRKENPHTFLVVTGCAAQLHPERFASMPEVDRVLGNKEKLSSINFKREGPFLNVGDIMQEGVFSDHLLSGFEGRSRAFLQIQQGCDYHCTFCIVPKVRGKNRSVSPCRIVSEAKRLVSAGFREFVLSGINIASYGEDNSKYPRLGGLTELLLQEVPGIKRLRFSSLDPGAFDEDLISLFSRENRLMPHIHFSLQSGNDIILKRMGRRHRREDIFSLCSKLRSIRPDIVFGSDFITGFPTESEEMFSDTIDLVNRCNIILLHVFPYSEREGTAAIKMPQVLSSIRKERAFLLRQEGERLLASYLSSRVGLTTSVLLEKSDFGSDSHYIPVKLTGKQGKAGEILDVKITGWEDKLLKGEII